MTLLMFGKQPIYNRKQKITPAASNNRPSPVYPASGYQPSQTTLSVNHIPSPQPPYAISPVSSPPPAPANPVWATSPGPYQHGLRPMLAASQASLPAYGNLPARPSTANSPPPPKPWATSVNLVPPAGPAAITPHAQAWFPSPYTQRPMTAAAAASTSNLCTSLQQKSNSYKQTASQSVTNFNDTLYSTTAAYMNQGAALCDRIASRLDAVITAIDGEVFSGNESELLVQEPDTEVPYGSDSRIMGDIPRRPDLSNPAVVKGKDLFSKVWLYSNSRLPPVLPPLKVYINTYQLLCLAAQYSESVYNRPVGAERETHVDADWRQGTKAMIIKSAPIDELNTIVFAVRGSQTFMDWAVNFRPAPASPVGFLDDQGNYCHSGFLHVARKMVEPVAARLRTLLEQNPSRSNYSLLITGHSAGGAVAQLLYSHMYSTSVNTPLSHLTHFFKRVHCITFGTPPVSLLPLRRAETAHAKKSVFFSLINEGDPVARADPVVVKSLLKLYTKPTPCPVKSSTGKCVATIGNLVTASTAAALKPAKKLPLPKPSKALLRPSKQQLQLQLPQSPQLSVPLPPWPVPPIDMSCAGRLVLLRVRPGGHGYRRPGRKPDEDVEAVMVMDEQLRGVVFGDPVCHMMALYVRRVERLAMKAVTAKGTG